MDVGHWAAWIGTIVGLLGGALGTAAAVKNTNNAREQACIIRWSISGFILIGAFLFLLFTIPKNYVWLAWIAYALALPAYIISGNARLARIRAKKGSSMGQEL